MSVPNPIRHPGLAKARHVACARAYSDQVPYAAVLWEDDSAGAHRFDALDTRGSVWVDVCYPDGSICELRDVGYVVNRRGWPTEWFGTELGLKELWRIAESMGKDWVQVRSGPNPFEWEGGAS